MTEREDAALLRRKEDEHVSMFKARVGMGAVIMEGSEIAAVARYIERLEQESASRTTPDREAVIAASMTERDETKMPDGSDIMQTWFECGRDVFVFYDRILGIVRRTTPDRNDIIDECVTEVYSIDEACTGALMQVEAARKLRALKTAPNGEKK